MNQFIFFFSDYHETCFLSENETAIEMMIHCQIQIGISIWNEIPIENLNVIGISIWISIFVAFSLFDPHHRNRDWYFHLNHSSWDLYRFWRAQRLSVWFAHSARVRAVSWDEEVPFGTSNRFAAYHQWARQHASQCTIRPIYAVSLCGNHKAVVLENGKYPMQRQSIWDRTHPKHECIYCVPAQWIHKWSALTAESATFWGSDKWMATVSGVRHKFRRRIWAPFLYRPATRQSAQNNVVSNTKSHRSYSEWSSRWWIAGLFHGLRRLFCESCLPSLKEEVRNLKKSTAVFLEMPVKRGRDDFWSC